MSIITDETFHKRKHGTGGRYDVYRGLDLIAQLPTSREAAGALKLLRDTQRYGAKYDPSVGETAACPWGAYLSFSRILSAAIETHHDSFGLAAHRRLVIELVPECELAYQVAVVNGYDEPFDLEFCPAFLLQWLAHQNQDEVRVGRQIAGVSP